MLEVDSATQLLKNVHYIPSPHCDERPKVPIDMIVVHNISLPPREFGTRAVEKFFAGELDFSAHPYFATIQYLRVSAHVFIDRQGEITQFVPFHLRAWHAGESVFQGKTHCNDFSIGIELEGADDVPYEKAQYQTLAELIQVLTQMYPAISRERIVGHSDIAPDRKTDPGPAFDWQHLDCLLENRKA